MFYIELTWIDNNHSEDGYTIYRKTSTQSEYSEIVSLGKNLFIYNDEYSNFEDGVTYNYKIDVYNTEANESSIIFSKKTWETKQIYDYREAAETLIGEIYLDPSGNYFDEANDTRYLKTATYNADRTREEFTTTFEAVSGIEFKFTENNKWLMRIGSIFTVVKTVNDDKIQITEHSATVEENWTGANTYSTTNSDNEYVSSSVHTITTTSATLFRYGLGYRPNENLSIDILGVFDGSGNVPTNGSENEDLLDLAFIKSLKLGFSLRW